MKIFNDELGRINKVRLSKKDVKKIMNPSNEYLLRRDEIFKEIKQKIEKTNYANGIIKVNFK